jgi:hypothetical protein
MESSRAKIADENPTIEPIDRSVTPARSARPEKAPTRRGTIRNEPIIVMLLVDRKRGPTKISPTAMTAARVIAIDATGLVRKSIKGRCGMT